MFSSLTWATPLYLLYCQQQAQVEKLEKRLSDDLGEGVHSKQFYSEFPSLQMHFS